MAACLLALGCSSAWAAGGGQGITTSGTAGRPPGAVGGVDGTAETAAGANGNPPAGIPNAGGGGGATDLTTGQGAAGGRQGVDGAVNTNVPGAAGAAGAAGLSTVSGAITGGTGLMGSPNIGVGGSGGGGGGIGVSTTVDLTIENTGRVNGGAGGVGGSSSGGGGGGAGVFSSTNVTVAAGGAITGGAGGRGNGLAGSGGGAAAVILTGAAGTIDNGGALGGGNGGSNTGLLQLAGAGGNGGEGVLLTAGGHVINRSGASITGGTAGPNGTQIANQGVVQSVGGAGIKGANVSVVNAGAITGGVTTSGTRADAIHFTGGVNSLEIWSTSSITGNVRAFSTADTFKLGGATDSNFDLSELGPSAKYDGFGLYEKVGTSTWTLAGTTMAATPWALSGGTLSISSDGNLGNPSGTLAFNGGTLQTTAGIVMNRATTLEAPGGTIETQAGTTLTQQGRISGSGGLAKTGDGTLTLTANNTYTGATTISAGTLQLGVGGTSGAIAGDVINNGLLVLNHSDTFNVPGAISGSGSLGQNGTGTSVLTGDLTYTGGTTVNAGTLQLGNGGTSGSIRGNVVNQGTLAFNRADRVSVDGIISGMGAIRQIGSGQTILSGNNSGFIGTTSIQAGTLAVNGNLCGSTNVGAGGRLQGNGTVCDTSNSGVIAPGNSIGTLTVAGNYVGNGGTLEMETALGGDTSPTDRLMVTGATSGTTTVRVINQGGTGARTVEGIKLVDVGGLSDGSFGLLGDYSIQGQPAVIAGAYGYTLQKNGVSTPTDGDWYLRSSLSESPAGGGAPMRSGPLYQPGVPVYEAYPAILLGLNSLSTLRQRVGDRYWGADTSASPALEAGQYAADADHGAWARVEGLHSRMKPSDSTAGTTTDTDQYKLQVGIDRAFLENKSGRLVGGLNAQYGNASSDIDSFYGTGRINADAYGLGGTLTWYGENGVYVDGQAQANWFSGKLSSRTLGQNLSKDNDGFGYALSVETGKRIGVSDGWSVTPQAQLMYSSVDFDSFTDPYGARVSMGKGDSMSGRLGVAADYQNAVRDSAGTVINRTSLYGIANLYYEFLDGTDVKVSGTRIRNADRRLAAGIGAGVAYSWAKEAYAVYGEVATKTNLEDFGDSYSYMGTVGLRVRF